MPGRNGTGPIGQGSLTGRGMGICGGNNPSGKGYAQGFGLGRGLGSGRGCGRGLGRNLFEERQRALEDQLADLRGKLDALSAKDPE